MQIGLRNFDKNTWQLQEAKNKLSEVVRRAAKIPQRITLRGMPSVVVLSQEEFDKKMSEEKQQSFVDFMLNSPLRGTNIKLPKRTKEPMRKAF
jgi:prevent-host-death family protein